MVLINAEKIKNIDWSHVTELEKKVTDSHKIKTAEHMSEDPNQGLMNIMKDM